MKRFNTSKIRVILPVCIVVVALTGFYGAGARYFDSNIGCFLQSHLPGPHAQGNLPWHCGSNPQNTSVSGCALACSLPKGWQTGWCGGKLWITHYNPNGTVADALPFDSLEDLCHWFESHPDRCDVDVEKTAPDITEDAMQESCEVRNLVRN